MRITAINTAEQRRAVTEAAAAARLILAKLDDADLVELAANDEPPVTKYQLLNIWSDGTDQPTSTTRTLLWSDVADFPQANHAALTSDDAATLQKMLAVAGETDPNVFGPGELAGGVWELRLREVIALDGSDQVAKLVAEVDRLDLGEQDLYVLVHEAYAGQDAEGDDADVEQVNAGGVQSQCAYLVDKFGYDQALLDVQSLADDVEAP